MTTGAAMSLDISDSQKITLASAIYEQLRDDIITGSQPPTHKLHIRKPLRAVFRWPQSDAGSAQPVVERGLDQADRPPRLLGGARQLAGIARSDPGALLDQ